MSDQLERAIKLAENRGDRVIIIDKEKDRSIVVMSLDEYELLLFRKNEDSFGVESLTETQLLDKINRDIALWKDERNAFKVREEISFFDENPDVFGEDFYNENDDIYYYEDEEDDDPEATLNFSNSDYLKERTEYDKRDKNWRIPMNIKRGADK